MRCHAVGNPYFDVNITNAHPRPRQHHHCSRRLRGHPQGGGRKRSTPGINRDFQVQIPPRQDSAVVQITEQLAGTASCQGLKGGKPPLDRRETAAAAAAAAAGFADKPAPARAGGED